MRKHPVVWIDFENTPHVPFFVPIILDLERAGCEVILTARNFAQTKELVERAGLNAQIIGSEYGNASVRKTFGILTRAVRLAMHVRKYHPSLAVGHGSRGLLLAAKLLGIRSLTLYDYEGASVRLFNKLSTYVMTPEVIPFATLASLGLTKEKHLTYPGLKEEVYVSKFAPSDTLLLELGLDSTKIIVTVRPPSETAHYRSDDSFLLFNGIMALLAARSDVQVVLMPRNQSQRSAVERWARHPNIVIPTHAVDGLNLLYHSDLVIGGGGTMNREAASLGVPVATIFKGELGAVDAGLLNDGRMIALNKADEVLPLLIKRERILRHRSNSTREKVVRAILQLVSDSTGGAAGL
jgi:predicted glycosyltransferase